MKHIIIGAGPAGVMAAETLRSHSDNDQILLIGDEQEAPYSRMALPYHLIGQIEESGTYLRKEPDHYTKHRIDLLHERVTHVDADKKVLDLGNGQSESFDKLLLATGSTPTRPPIPGMDLEGVYNCWTLADAREIIKRAKPGSKAVLMGAGFIGCIILEALVAEGTELTVVEMENRMVPRMMNEHSGSQLKQWCIDKGVNVLTDARVQSVEKPKAPGLFAGLLGKSKSSGDHALNVVLANGEVLQTDLLICATGVKPNIEMLESSQVKLDHGVLVNQHLESSHADIYAAGDVAVGLDFSTGGYSVQAVQPTAVEHGRIAAINMAKGNTLLHRGSINMNVLDTMGLISASFGHWEGVDGGDFAELKDAQRYRYLNLQFKDDVIIGANSLGLTQHVGVLRGLIQSETRLGKWKKRLQQDPSRIMEAWLSQTQSI